jgi:hypothetical protein
VVSHMWGTFVQQVRRQLTGRDRQHLGRRGEPPAALMPRRVCGVSGRVSYSCQVTPLAVTVAVSSRRWT